jgi:hypothetical protein
MGAWILLLAVIFFGAAQDNSTPKTADSFYSGSVAEVNSEKIVVTRVVLGKQAENRTFIITSATKVEGKLRAKERVTVRYQTTEQGDVAVSIVVRTAQQKKKP